MRPYFLRRFGIGGGCPYIPMIVVVVVVVVGVVGKLPSKQWIPVSPVNLKMFL